MKQEQNRSPEPDAVEPDAVESDAAEAGGAGPSGVTAAAGKHRPRRSTSAPTRLKQAADLLHTVPAAAASSGEAVADTNAKPGANAKSGTGRAPAGRNAGILPKAAAEDDPRAWGDSPDDTSGWLREQRPPHWG